MSDENYNKEPVDMLSVLTKEQLEDILRSEYMSDEPDVELIKRVNRAMKSKSEKNTPFYVDTKWQEFQNDYIGTEPLYISTEESVANQTSTPTAPRKLHSSIRVAVAVAALIVLLSGTVTAYALGYDVFGAIATWTKETFSFTQQTEMYPSNAAASPNLSGVSELQAALDEYGIKEKLAPTYIPEGYEQLELCVDTLDTSTLFTIAFENEDNTIIIQIRKYTAVKNRADYEKDDGSPEIYVNNDIPHYIMTNMGKYRAIWANGTCEVNISGVKTKNELVKMIDSVYER